MTDLFLWTLAEWQREVGVGFLSIVIWSNSIHPQYHFLAILVLFSTKLVALCMRESCQISYQMTMFVSKTFLCQEQQKKASKPPHPYGGRSMTILNNANRNGPAVCACAFRCASLFVCSVVVAVDAVM